MAGQLVLGIVISGAVLKNATCCIQGSAALRQFGEPSPTFDVITIVSKVELGSENCRCASHLAR